MNAAEFWRIVENDEIDIFEDMEPETAISRLQDLMNKISESEALQGNHLDAELSKLGVPGTSYILGGIEQIQECCYEYQCAKENEDTEEE